jgi:hypothetical protein
MPKTYEPIATTTVSGSAAATIDFTNISQSYTDLVAIASVKPNTSSNFVTARWGNNSYDTGFNYSATGFFARRNGSNTGEEFASERRTNNNQTIPFTYPPTGTNSFGTVIFQFQNYANTTTLKSVLYGCSNLDSSNYPYGGTERGVILWQSTAAINQIRFYIQSDNLAIGSTITLYGIKAA